jgi:lipid II:glycine glycyltransferase (peptidoglycan interpeptide bridge formation enzyme)
MAFEIKQIENKQTWDELVQSGPEYTFLHSWNWGEFSKAMGHKVWRLGIYDSSALAGVALVVGIKARRGSFLFVPHGPVLKFPISNFQFPNKSQISNNKFQEILEFLVAYLKKIAKEEKCSFIRISPLLERNKENQQIFDELGFRRAPIHMHAESTLLLDITKPEEELFKNMRKTTRYLIRRMEKEGVEIQVEDPPQGDHFLRLQEKVAERKHFIVFSKRQIKSEIEIFCSDGEAVVFNALYGGKVIASAIIVYYGYRAFYYQSASYCENKNISAPYLMVWRAVEEAKKRGCKIFDFYGASPENKPNHPWAGPTLFKLGYGSHRIDYLPAQDLVLNSKYWLTFVIEKIRKIKRGF